MEFVLKKLFSKPVIPICWTMLTIILLCLPGNALPGKNLFLFKIPYFDKVAHIILFAGVVFSWCLFLFNSVVSSGKMILIAVPLTSTLLGVILEFVQYYFVPNRDFDAFDIVANATGSVVAALLLTGKK